MAERLMVGGWLGGQALPGLKAGATIAPAVVAGAIVAR